MRRSILALAAALTLTACGQSQSTAGQVTLLKDEGSHMLMSLSEANALAYLAADRRTWSAGDMIEVHYLPR